MYCGISSTLFDQLVADGRMPRPRRINGRKVWDVRELDLAFDALPHEDGPRSSWEDA
jgi:predicted DNA-binding transcriptional regulator AlpA